MRLKNILLLAGVLALGACTGGHFFEKHIDINNHVWAKTDVIRFDVPVTDTESLYDIFIAVRHMSAYPYANVLVSLTIETPAGEIRVKQHDLIIRNTDGSFKGDGLGDYWDIEVPVFKEFEFRNEGTYKFSIENRMHLTEMPGIMAMGLVIKKSNDTPE